MVSTPIAINADGADVQSHGLIDDIGNGDPFVAVLHRTDENGVSTHKKMITLGTGFTSMDDIGYAIQQRLQDPDHFDIEIGFVPDSADVFALAGRVDLDV